MRFLGLLLAPAILAACAATPASDRADESAALTAADASAPATLRFTEEFVLQKVLEKKHIAYDANRPLPELRYASQVTLTEFQDAVEPQWHQRPNVITNVFVVALNRIYLIDDATYYTSHHRFIDDSLAHELTHYVQSKYQGWVLDGADDSIEMNAIDVQTWFRQTYCVDHPSTP